MYHIMEKYFVCNTQYMINVCIVQSKFKGWNFLTNLFAISNKFNKEKKFIFIIYMCLHKKAILMDIILYPLSLFYVLVGRTMNSGSTRPNYQSIASSNGHDICFSSLKSLKSFHLPKYRIYDATIR